jgi:glycosyltransferase involved in cell wall biosynthesis
MWHAIARLGDLEMIVETDLAALSLGVFVRVGGSATVRRGPTGALPATAFGTSERPIPLGLCPKSQGPPENANCTSCATVRELPASTLWWHRAGGVVSDRRTGATGARGYPVRQRRFTDYSNTAGTLRASVAPRSHCKDPLPYHFISLHRLAQTADAFDIIHFHTDYLHFPLFAQRWGKTVTTLHGRLDLPDRPPILREFVMMPLVSISNAQRAPMPWANWYATVYHGLPTSLYQCGGGAGGYLAFIGRMCPEKRPDWAIEIARRARLPLTIAAKVDKVDRSYYKTRIKPLLKDPLIEFIGEIRDDEKGAFLGDALALLFPIDWPEPFGLAVIEAMANGTPIIAFGRGAVPEIVDHGVTGFIVNDIDEAVAAIPLAKALDRNTIRRRFEERFSVERMARDYLARYSDVLRRDTLDVVLSFATAAQAAANAA